MRDDCLQQWTSRGLKKVLVLFFKKNKINDKQLEKIRIMMSLTGLFRSSVLVQHGLMSVK